MDAKKFENTLKPFLLWMGTIVAGIMGIAYIVVVFILIEGFKVEELLNTTVFSIVTAGIGFCIMQMLKLQGQSFAENIDENVTIIKKYHRIKGMGEKAKKPKSMKYYWIKSGALDIIIKCLTLALTSIGMIYIMIEGSGDYNLLFLAGVNLLMFAGFGLIGLVKTYDFFNNEFVPYMLLIIEEHTKIETEKNIKETK